MPSTTLDLLEKHLDDCPTCTPWSPRCPQGIALVEAAAKDATRIAGIDEASRAPEVKA